MKISFEIEYEKNGMPRVCRLCDSCCNWQLLLLSVRIRVGFAWMLVWLFGCLDVWMFAWLVFIWHPC